MFCGLLLVALSVGPALAQGNSAVQQPITTGDVPPTGAPSPAAEPPKDITPPPPIPVLPTSYNKSQLVTLAVGAQSGDAAAQYTIGDAYLRGRPVPMDKARAAAWFRKAAAQGYAEAEFELGAMARFVPPDATPDYAEGSAWFRKAADQGHGASQSFLGAMYAEGLGVPQDYVQAYKWLDLGASATRYQLVGDTYIKMRDDIAAKLTPAQLTEAQAQVKGWQPVAKTADQLATDASEAFNRSEDAEALKLLTPLAEAGNPYAQYMLGVMHQKGYGVTADSKAAVAWFRKAAEQGHAASQFALAVRYLLGDGVAQDYGMMIEWDRKAADQGFLLAQGTLGEAYHFGFGVAKDDQQAELWLRKAADQGNGESQYGLGELHSSGPNVLRDWAEAYKWYALAADYAPREETRTKATTMRDALAAEMAPYHLSKGKSLVKTWAPVFEVVP